MRGEFAVALTTACLLVAGTGSRAAQTNPVRTLGSFPWDTSTADVLLQQVSSDRLVVQVRIVTESNTSAGRRQTRPVPTESMEAWVLLDDGTALEQTPRQPPKGAPPVGVGNAGDNYAFVTFGFKSTSKARVAAVVVKVEGQFHVFGASQENSPYVIGKDVQVSAPFPGGQYYETQIAADPAAASHLLIGAYATTGDGSIDNVFYVSFDRGRTWTRTLRVPVGVDPAVAIGAKGVAFAATIHDVPRPDGSSRSVLVVHRSTDGGRGWRESVVQVESGGVDRNYIAVDDVRQRVYVHGYLQDARDAEGKRTASAFVLYASDDGGRAFTRLAVREPAGPATPKLVPANGIVLPDGTFVALAATLDATRLNMFKGRSDAASAPELNGVLGILRSVDGGRTLERLAQIAEVHYDWRVPQLSMAGLAIDRSTGPFRGRVYAVWPDARVDRRTQIFIASSDDGGRTWTAPRLVSDDRPSSPNPRPNQFMPAVAVNRNGVVAVSWYDRRDNPDNLGYWPRFSASLDGGATFLSSVRVSTAPRVVLDTKETRLNGGDTAGLTADADGTFHAVWVDNRTGTHQVWTAPVEVRGAARR